MKLIHCDWRGGGGGGGKNLGEGRGEFLGIQNWWRGGGGGQHKFAGRDREGWVLGVQNSGVGVLTLYIRNLGGLVGKIPPPPFLLGFVHPCIVSRASHIYIANASVLEWGFFNCLNSSDHHQEINIIFAGTLEILDSLLPLHAAAVFQL